MKNCCCRKIVLYNGISNEVLWRFDANRNLDESFGNNGMVVFDADGKQNLPEAASLQSDRKL